MWWDVLFWKILFPKNLWLPAISVWSSIGPSIPNHNETISHPQPPSAPATAVLPWVWVSYMQTFSSCIHIFSENVKSYWTVLWSTFLEFYNLLSEYLLLLIARNQCGMHVLVKFNKSGEVNGWHGNHSLKFFNLHMVTRKFNVVITLSAYYALKNLEYFDRSCLHKQYICKIYCSLNTSHTHAHSRQNKINKQIKFKKEWHVFGFHFWLNLSTVCAVYSRIQKIVLQPHSHVCVKISISLPQF